MRILLTADAELPVPPRLYGGIERIVAELVEAFCAEGHTVGLVAHRDSTARANALFRWPGETSTRWGDSWQNLQALKVAVGVFRPDVVHSFSRLLWLWPLRGVLPSVPLIMSYQREPSGRTIRGTRWWLGKRLSFTGCSEHIAERGKAIGGGEWAAIPNFVEVGKFPFVEKVKADAPLVFLSRIERIKGVHNAIAIAQGAGRKLLIAGNRVDSMEGESYWEEEVAPHLSDEVQYVGPVNDDEKARLLGQAAAMVVPIEWEEPFGIVFAEALACGTPVISCLRGSLPSIIEDGKEGFLIESIEEGIEAVDRLADINRSACRLKAETQFSREVVAQQYLELYERRLAGT